MDFDRQDKMEWCSKSIIVAKIYESEILYNYLFIYFWVNEKEQIM